MQGKTKFYKFFLPSILCSLILFLAAPKKSEAGYLVRPMPCTYSESECVIVKKYYVVKHKPKHIIHKKHYYKHYYHHIPCYRYHTCSYGCQQRDFVEFIAAPAPSGCYVNLDECDDYAPDRITGDDDPMVYPGMDIDE